MNVTAHSYASLGEYGVKTTAPVADGSFNAGNVITAGCPALDLKGGKNNMIRKGGIRQ